MTQLAIVTSEEPKVRAHSGYRLIIAPGRKRVRAVLGGELGLEVGSHGWRAIEAGGSRRT